MQQISIHEFINRVWRVRMTIKFVLERVQKEVNLSATLFPATLFPSLKICETCTCKLVFVSYKAFNHLFLISKGTLCKQK